ncbi:unnamed protein product [Trifolium pratense]|uniref:Uncharacterized protein n=1 Tax=Trifolium pratense TaxID=57577 RepID=A0ACB0K8X7_TRIPR|nr:unnamed protein product [Trifolium pratense]
MKMIRMYFFCCHDNILARQSVELEATILACIQSHHTVKDVIMHVCRNENEEVVGCLLWYDGCYGTIETIACGMMKYKQDAI